MQPARLVVLVESAARRAQLTNLIVESLQSPVIVNLGNAGMEAWPRDNFPVFKGHNHMQFQIDDPQGFSAMLAQIIETDELPELPFCH